ncbi:polyphosphate kinase 2 [Pseudooceanicola algae]|uniref:ADP/GDP-polyphosphate phosphotransferase n=1 Tax=Pseudooceanicola algae TaxID=1537215 RepID=A0A418SDX9_9RHOB|nr:polyphosphate kinase 2 [Pseudooceanicola algae]QPM89530.1 Polyphosphate:NDP phosphotransferase 3 [Pseudooceanicola algae]
MQLPFDGAISAFFKEDAPDHVRKAIRRADRDEILNDSYPYSERMARKAYERELALLQIELVRMQAWAKSSGARIVCVFEGRDAAGKGGVIKRFREHLNPRGAQVVALSAPNEYERGQWYFQRYVDHLPSAGEITFYDRSWYNRAVVEHVFDFCTDEQRRQFFEQVPDFESLLVSEGIQLFKFWLNVGQAEQLNRFLAREQDPLKQWKLSNIDVEGLHKWDDYSKAISETLERTDTEHAPWTIVRSDDKRRARLAAIRHVLKSLDYDGKSHKALGEVDESICSGTDIWNA